MENKLFYRDAYIRDFKTSIVKQATDEEGRHYVVLEETAFYPTGGGQPFDKGTIDHVLVENVEEVEGEIRHYLERPLPADGDVLGKIDWGRRFDHMQQHAGQHILSAAFVELFGLETIGFHLGEETLTIDLDTEDLTEEQADRVETLANQIIIENRQIETKWITAGELSKYPIRKQPSVLENIRLVIIADFDYNGCGGTHPSTTGQVAAIKILDWERQKKKIRVTFICGKRVIKQLHQKHVVLNGLTKLLNSPESEMQHAVTRLLETERTLEKSLEEARGRLLDFEVKELLKNHNGVITGVFQNRSIQELQKMARLLTVEDETIIVLLVAENDHKLQFVCARGQEAVGNMKKLAAEILQSINGKGGGNETLAQGGGEASISGEELLRSMQDAMNQVV